MSTITPIDRLVDISNDRPQIDIFRWENGDFNSASLLLDLRQKKINPNGSSTSLITDISLLDVAFNGGLQARVGQEVLGKKEDPGFTKRTTRLANITEGLIMQNPPRKIRPWRNLPTEL